jgi:hypothetical protein
MSWEKYFVCLGESSFDGIYVDHVLYWDYILHNSSKGISNYAPSMILILSDGGIKITCFNASLPII